MSTPKQKYIWLLIEAQKKTRFTSDGKVDILPNRKRVKIKSVVLITTDSVEKNYCKAITKNAEYFFNGSMSELEKLLGIQFFQINKSTKIRMEFCYASTNSSYLFLKYIDVALRVTKPYQENIKQYIEM